MPIIDKKRMNSTLTWNKISANLNMTVAFLGVSTTNILAGSPQCRGKMAIRRRAFAHLSLDPTVDDTLCSWATTGARITGKVFSSTPSVTIVIKFVSTRKVIRKPLCLCLEVIAPLERDIALAIMFMPTSCHDVYVYACKTSIKTYCSKSSDKRSQQWSFLPNFPAFVVSIEPI